MIVCKDVSQHIATQKPQTHCSQSCFTKPNIPNSTVLPLFEVQFASSYFSAFQTHLCFKKIKAILGYETIILGDEVDLGFGFLGDLHLFFHLVAGELGIFQTEDQGGVLQLGTERHRFRLAIDHVDIY